MDCHLLISLSVTRLSCNVIVILLTGKVESSVYFCLTVDYRSLVREAISILLSNQVTFLLCLHEFLNCSSSHLPLSCVSLKNNYAELQKMIKTNVIVCMVQHTILSLMGEGFSHSLLSPYAFLLFSQGN